MPDLRCIFCGRRLEAGACIWVQLIDGNHFFVCLEVEACPGLRRRLGGPVASAGGSPTPLAREPVDRAWPRPA